jgi:C4-type Zn-finger protein
MTHLGVLDDMDHEAKYETDVTLECPLCGTYKTVSRPADVPANVRVIKIVCPDCDDGDFHIGELT